MRMLALAHILVRSLLDIEKSDKDHILAHKAVRCACDQSAAALCPGNGRLHEKVSEHFMRDLDSLGICFCFSKDLPGWQIQVPCAMDGALELVAYGRNNLAQMLREARSRNM